MRWCEENTVDYVLGLAKNQRLTKILGRALHKVHLQFEATGQPARQFEEFSYSTRKSWSPYQALFAQVFDNLRRWLPAPVSLAPA